MKVHGIDFKHRRPQDIDLSSKDYAEFTAFAALCEAAGVARFVRSVFFDTKWQGFDIEADPKIENTLSHQLIAICALQSLPQFILFGTYECQPNNP